MPDQTETPLEERIHTRTNRILHQSDFMPGIVKARHIEGMIIFRGLAADRPSGTTEIQAYFATDSGVLSIWDGGAWLSTTLS